MNRLHPHMRLPSRVRRLLSLYAHFLSNRPLGPAPSSVSHLSSLSRRIGTGRSTDFDAIPSPGKTSGLARSSHSHSLRADLDVSRSNMKERPRPKPVHKPHTPDPASSPEPDEDSDENVTNDAVAEPASPSPRYRGNNLSKHGNLHLRNLSVYYIHCSIPKLVNPISDLLQKLEEPLRRILNRSRKKCRPLFVLAVTTPTLRRNLMPNQSKYMRASRHPARPTWQLLIAERAIFFAPFLLALGQMTQGPRTISRPHMITMTAPHL